MTQKKTLRKPCLDAVVNAHSAELAAKQIISASQGRIKNIIHASTDQWLSWVRTKWRRSKYRKETKTVTWSWGLMANL